MSDEEEFVGFRALLSSQIIKICGVKAILIEIILSWSTGASEEFYTGNCYYNSHLQNLVTFNA